MKSFTEIPQHDYETMLKDRIKNEIEGQGKSYILGIDEDEYKTFLCEKFKLESLIIDKEAENIGEPSKNKGWREDMHYREQYEVEYYNFTVTYPFSGTSELFKIRPGEWVMTSYEIYVSAHPSNVSLRFQLDRQDPVLFTKTKNEAFGRAFTNIENINKFVNNWNNNVRGIVKGIFDPIKTKYLKENDFFAAINLKVDKNTSSVFSAPTIQKKIIPKPTIEDKKEFKSEPTMSSEGYFDILKVIYEFGKSMERKPSTYKGKDEEGLRDQFLLILETRYEQTTATGETFNRGGKTDIILKYAKDGSNLFVAECKFWHGAAEFLKAISQLFDRYLTWRDSKASLILFIANKDFTNVINTVLEETKKHPYFLSEKGKRGESSFSYLFHLPQDKNKNVFFEIILFHFDK